MKIVYPILDTSAGHNKNLVNAINNAYFNGNRTHFQAIVYALYLRDYEECDDKELEIPTSVGQVNDTHMEMYLRRVADDLDLQTILDFMRLS